MTHWTVRLSADATSSPQSAWRHRLETATTFAGFCGVSDLATLDPAVSAEICIGVAAALIHPCGVGQDDPGGHLLGSDADRERALARLAADSRWSGATEMLDQVSSALAALGDTRRRFPSPGRSGSMVRFATTERRVDAALSPEWLSTRLEEADALAHLSETGRELSLIASRQSVTSASDNNTAANITPAWDVSTAGNRSLFVRAALLAVRRDELRTALMTAVEGEDEAARRKGIAVQFSDHVALITDARTDGYWDDLVAELDGGPAQIAKEEAVPSSMRLTNAGSFDELRSLLIAAPLKGLPLRPYATSSIACGFVDPSRLQPSATYVLRNSLRRLCRQVRDWADCFALTPFDLSGILQFEADGVSYRIGPPIVEDISNCQWANEGESALIVDGLHRMWVARKLGITVRAVSISDPSAPLPVCAIGWDAVNITTEVPPKSERRVYRAIPIDESALYFSQEGLPVDSAAAYYRDFGFLGSAGRRPDPSSTQHSPGEAS